MRQKSRNMKVIFVKDVVETVTALRLIFMSPVMYEVLKGYVEQPGSPYKAKHSVYTTSRLSPSHR